MQLQEIVPPRNSQQFLQLQLHDSIDSELKMQ